MLSPDERLPATLQSILSSLQNPPPASNVAALRAEWAAYLAAAREQVPGLRIEAGGENVYLGELSPGCQACKAGSWDCIFTTTKCNLHCEFCYSPQYLPGDYAGSAFGKTPAEIAANHARTQITGISFSGGEPFLAPQKLIAWLAWFKAHAPDQYFWVYTNGLLVGEACLRQLAHLGLDEIRFNLAATGYRHPHVLDNLSLAARHIPNLTVEIPAIPEQASLLLSSLAEWCSRGVKFLNVHELLYEPGTLSAAMPGQRRPICLEDGHQAAINPDSRSLILAVMQKVQAEGLPLAVNVCSLHSKLRQLRGRRRSLAPLTQEPFEQLVGETLVSCCVYRDASDFRFCHPECLSDYPGCKAVRLVRYAPLALHAPKQWISYDEC